MIFTMVMIVNFMGCLISEYTFYTQYLANIWFIFLSGIKFSDGKLMRNKEMNILFHCHMRIFKKEKANKWGSNYKYAEITIDQRENRKTRSSFSPRAQISRVSFALSLSPSFCVLSPLWFWTEKK